MATPIPNIPVEAQIEALARSRTHLLLAAHGVQTHGPAAYLRVSRQQVIDYFQQHPEAAEAHVSAPSQRPFHDHLCLERRGERFVVFDMDHGRPRGEQFYDSLHEAAADFVAYQIGYGYQSA